MISFLRFILTSVLVLGVLAYACGCSIGAVDLSRHEYTQIIMGVEARIVLYSENEQTARRAAKAAFDRMNDLDAVLSDYRVESELMRVCRASGGPPIHVSDDLFRVLIRAHEIAMLSNGAFDPSVGPIVQLWRKARRTGDKPGKPAITEAMSRVGWSKIALDSQERTVQLAVPNIQLDLGGIGKGFAADEALATLIDLGAARCLVDLGGDIAVGDPPPGKNDWRVAVATGLESSQQFILNLNNQAVATSGDSEQFVDIHGKRYSHIIDPRTGLPLTNRIAVTVIAPDAALADALASAISVLGPDDGLALLASFPHSSARIVLQDSHDPRLVESADFPASFDADFR